MKWDLSKTEINMKLKIKCSLSIVYMDLSKGPKWASRSGSIDVDFLSGGPPTRLFAAVLPIAIQRMLLARDMFQNVTSQFLALLRLNFFNKTYKNIKIINILLGVSLNLIKHFNIQTNYLDFIFSLTFELNYMRVDPKQINQFKIFKNNSDDK